MLSNTVVSVQAMWLSMACSAMKVYMGSHSVQLCSFSQCSCVLLFFPHTSYHRKHKGSCITLHSSFPGPKDSLGGLVYAVLPCET